MKESEGKEEARPVIEVGRSGVLGLTNFSVVFIGPGQILDPQKPGVDQLHRLGQGHIKGDKDRHLKDHRQAAPQGIDLVPFVKIHHLFVEFLRVTFIKRLELAHLRLKILHPLGGKQALARQGKHEQVDQDR